MKPLKKIDQDDKLNIKVNMPMDYYLNNALTDSRKKGHNIESYSVNETKQQIEMIYTDNNNLRIK